MKHLFNATLLLLALLLPANAIAYDFVVDGIYYNVNGTEATVTSKGSGYTSNTYSGDVVIPATVNYNGNLYTVTAIGAHAFWFCNALTSIDLPNTITSIGSSAFWGCTSLTSILIPKSVISISSSVGMSSSDHSNPFAVESIKSIQVESGNPKYDSRNNCNAIIETQTNTLISGCQNTVIPNTVTIIADGAFSHCHMLKNIEIPNSVTTIGVDSFRECYGLTHLVIPNSVTTILGRAFYDCHNLESVILPTSVTFDQNLGLSFWLCSTPSSIMITGVDEWQAGRIPIPMSINKTKLYIDSRITSIKDMDAGPSDVYCYAPNPPYADGAFYDYTGTLHVPAASLAAYFTAPIWSNFTNIVGDAVEPSAVIHTQDSIEMDLGQQMDLVAQVIPTNAFPYDITWTSTNPSVADVQNGTVTAISPGECDIIARCLYQQAVCHVIINNNTVEIALDQQEAMLLPNHMLILTPNASPVIPDDYSVTSSNSAVAAARMANGKIQVVGIKEGMTVITVGSTDGTAKPATCVVTVYTERGDVNNDGFVNITDAIDLINDILNGVSASFYIENADCNNDGDVNISDVIRLINYILSGVELEPKEPNDSTQDETETITVNGVSFTMVRVDGGSFMMGCTPEQNNEASSNEAPVHRVTLSPYYIGQTEVTQELWQAVMGSNPSNFATNSQNPVEKVTWNDCQEFISQLNQLTGKTFRLPTEAEWEFAACGGNKSRGYTYSGSNDINEIAWFNENSESTTHPVGLKKANELGLFDMTGNVHEWCYDRYGFYPEAPQTDPQGPETGSSKIYRGGSWQNTAANSRNTRRNYFAPGVIRNYMGLRLVMTP